jgi:hypothetical protein
VAAWTTSRLARARHTLAAIYGRDLRAPESLAAHRRMIAEAVLRYVQP